MPSPSRRSGTLAIRFRLVPYASRLRDAMRTAHGLIESREGWFVLAAAFETGRTGFPAQAWHDVQPDPFGHGAGIAAPIEPKGVGAGPAAIGVGEAAPLPTHGTETPSETRAVLERLPHRDWELALAASAPAIFRAVEDFLAGAGIGFDTPAARFAVETALLDLAGRLLGFPVADFLGGPRRSAVPVNALLEASDPEALAAEARRAWEQGFRTIKLKLGAIDPAADLARVRTVRSAIGPQAALRLDANRAWDLATARRMLDELASLDVEFLEEPLADGTLPAFPGNGSGPSVPLALDESLGAWLKAGAGAWPRTGAGACPKGGVGAGSETGDAGISPTVPDVFVLKPSVLGGLGAALGVARAALASGSRLTVTSGFEREVGVAAALHLACALPVLDLACGLATLDRFELVACRELEPRQGVMVLPAGPGLGITHPAEILGERGEPGPVEASGGQARIPSGSAWPRGAGRS